MSNLQAHIKLCIRYLVTKKSSSLKVLCPPQNQKFKVFQSHFATFPNQNIIIYLANPDML